MSVLKEVVSQFKELTIVCPDCEWMYSDEQYTCTTCWCEGGHGKLNIYNYLLERNVIPKIEIKNND